ncbi:MAG: 3-oxoacid CoA-transferase subunit B [Acetobacteraceae bacterium]|nr:3-oxoacid CoA-transferase subunit B [Acetobacteraceae bacterium]
MREEKGLSRQAMCNLLAAEFQDGWIVNLGVGIPTMCSNADFGDRVITLHSENGVIGYGPIATPEQEDRHLVNAGGQKVTINPGASIVHHADSFSLIRAGKIDVTVMGAYEVSGRGDFANWKLKGAKGGGIGGAMDLAACAKRVFIVMEHVTRTGAPRIVENCSLPITAPGVVKMVATNYGLFSVFPNGITMDVIAPGITVDEVKSATGCALNVAENLRVAQG